MKDAMSGIDAVGYQARDRAWSFKRKLYTGINDLVRLVNPTGHPGIIGVFITNDSGGANEHTKKGEYSFLLGNYEKSLTVKTGQTSVKKIILMVRDMIIAGVAKTGFIVSYRISIEDAPAVYRECSQSVDCYTKMVIKFKY